MVIVENDIIKITNSKLAMRLDAHRYSKSVPFWSVPRTIGALREIVFVLRQMAQNVEADKVLNIALKDLENKKKLLQMKRAGTKEVFHPLLRQEQNDDVAFGLEVIKQKGFMFFFDDMRTGKTPKTIALSDKLNARKIIVVELKNVVLQFAEEFKKWQSIERIVTPLNGKSPIQRKKVWENFFKSDESQVVLVTYETLAGDFMKGYIDGEFDFLIADEPHKKIISTTTKNYKGLKKVNQMAKARVFATGTPIKNMIEEVYPYLSLAMPNTFKEKFAFQKRYFEITESILGATKFKTVVGWKRQSEIMELLQTCSTNRKNKQWMPTIKTVEIPMSKRQKEFIADMTMNGEVKAAEKVEYTFTDEFGITYSGLSKWKIAKTAMTKKLYLRESLVAVGAMKGFKVKQVPPKLKYILKFHSKHPNAKIMVFTQKTSLIKKLEKTVFKKLKMNYGIIHGGTTAKYNESVRNDINDPNGKINFVIGNILTMSTGGTYSGITHIFFMDLPFNPAEFDQAKARLLAYTNKENEGKEVIILKHDHPIDDEDWDRLKTKWELQKPVNDYENKIKEIKSQKEVK